MTRPKSLHRLGDGNSGELRTANMCVYSHPGEGKTCFWGTGGDTVLFMDSDHGTESAEALGSNSFRMPVVDYEELESAYQFVKHDIAKELPSVRWVVWDSMTLFQDRALIDDIMPDVVAENPRQDEFVPSRREYLINMNKIMRYVRQFVELPINFGVSCHVDIDKDPSDNSTLYMPLVQGKNMPTKFTGYMNVVGFLGKATVDKKTVQRMLVQRSGKFYAKDRFNAMGKHLDKPTLPKVDAAIAEARARIQTTSPARPVRRRRVRKAS